MTQWNNGSSYSCMFTMNVAGMLLLINQNSLLTWLLHYHQTHEQCSLLHECWWNVCRTCTKHQVQKLPGFGLFICFGLWNKDIKTAIKWFKFKPVSCCWGDLNQRFTVLSTWFTSEISGWISKTAYLTHFDALMQRNAIKLSNYSVKTRGMRHDWSCTAWYFDS